LSWHVHLTCLITAGVPGVAREEVNWDLLFEPMSEMYVW